MALRSDGKDSSRDMVLAAPPSRGGRSRGESQSSTVVKIQRQQIEKLKKDNDRLKEDLALETRQAKMANTMSASAQIAKLADQSAMYERKIDVEKQKWQDLDAEKKKLEDLLLKHQRLVGSSSSSTGHQDLQKKIRTLENRLDKALVKYNEAKAHNKQLRAIIDSLRKERGRTDEIYQQELLDLQKKQKAIEDLSREREEAEEARARALREMVELKEKADRDQTNLELEWTQLGHLVEKDRRKSDHMSTKDRQGGLKNADPALAEEEKLRMRVTKGAWGIAKDKANIHLSMQRVQEFEEAFAKIQKATGIIQVDELVQTFIRAEDQNFSLFNYVNDLTNEIEKMENATGEVKEEIKKYKGQAPGPADNSRKKLVEALEDRLTKADRKGNMYQERYQQATKTIKSLKDGIAALFRKIGCEGTPAAEMLGTAGVTETNMMQYLGIIEQRTNELIAQLNRLRQGDAPDGAGGGGAGDAGLQAEASAAGAGGGALMQPPAGGLSPRAGAGGGAGAAGLGLGGKVAGVPEGGESEEEEEGEDDGAAEEPAAAGSAGASPRR